MSKVTGIVGGVLVVAAMWLPTETQAQTALSEGGVVGTALQIRQLDGVKRVLMIGAHPDDEDTSLLTTLSRGMGTQTAYLSLTRGEGGQNLIGPEMHEGLGIIRTGELVAARRLDGGAQFFTRAFDFGYSKNIDETLAHWSREELLRDVVWVIRTFRPHVIITIFSGTDRDGHGQHQVAGVLAKEGFAVAGDPTRFPEMASQGASAWTVSKLYRSALFSPQDATVFVPTGGLDPVLGRSHYQLAMASRSQHRSQDMGVGQPMGSRESVLQLMESRVNDPGTDDGIFAGVDTTFVGQLAPMSGSRISDLVADYRKALQDASSNLSVVELDAAVPDLANAGRALRNILESTTDADRKLLEARRSRLSEATLSAAGVVVDVRSGRDFLTPGESVIVDVTVWNGGRYDVADVVANLALPVGWTAVPTEESAIGAPQSRFFRQTIAETPIDGRIPAGGIGRWSWKVQIPADAVVSDPYYLQSPRTSDLYTWPEETNRWAHPFDRSPIRATVDLTLTHTEVTRQLVSPVKITVRREADYVGVDKAVGEYRQPLLVVPALSVEVTPRQMVWPTGSGGSREVTVVVTNTSASVRRGSLRLDVPAEWRTEPATIDFDLGPDGANRSFVFQTVPTGTITEGHHTFDAVATEVGGTQFNRSLALIDYPHIKRTALFSAAAAQVSAFDVVADTDLSVAYIMGSGDDGPGALEQMGMTVDRLDEAAVRSGNFSDYDVVVLGVRAYEVRPDLVSANETLMQFARSGGTVIVQYNKYEFPAGNFAPFPVTINRPHDRVTDETAAVMILDPDNPIFSGLNKLDENDFGGWVQERGLYFLGEWDSAYTPVMEMADPGEDAKQGALLVAPLGDGLYVYTGLAFFRQFPAGVPGAYRLFANLVSLRATAWRSWATIDLEY